MENWQNYKVSVPEGETEDWAVQRFTISRQEAEIDQLRAMCNPQRANRSVVQGTYTRLVGRGGNEQVIGVMMSDTPAEIMDQAEAFARIENGARTVLITGLGLGLTVQAALNSPTVTHVCVTEIDSEVILLVGPHYQKMAQAKGKMLLIANMDAHYFVPSPPKCSGEDKWDVAWHDIWPDISEANIRDMLMLMRKFKRKVKWQGCWSLAEARAQRTRIRTGTGWY